MENTNFLWSNSRKRVLAPVALAVSALLATAYPLAAAAEEYTLLVNTEAFITIDNGDGAAGTPIALRFGSSSEYIQHLSNGSDLFEISGGIVVHGTITASGSITTYGNITASGSLTINSDNTGNATLNFGNDGGTKTLIYDDAQERFEFSSDVHITDDLTVSGLTSCSYVITDADGKLACGTDSFLTSTVADDLYVNVSGDTMTGTLIINDEQSVGLAVYQDITATGSLTLNNDGTGVGTLTFANSTGNESLTLNAAGDWFNFTTNVEVDGTLSGRYLYSTGGVEAVGTVTGSVLDITGNQVTINGVTYYFPSSQGSAGQILENDGSGNLTWTTPASTTSTASGNYIYLAAEYAGAVYVPDGSNNVGQLALKNDATQGNYYEWSTSGTDQDYGIHVQVKLPDDFSGWKSAPTLAYNIDANSTVGVSVTGGGGTDTSSCSTTGSWQSCTLDVVSNNTFAAGNTMDLVITLTTRTGQTAEVGALYFEWTTPAS